MRSLELVPTVPLRRYVQLIWSFELGAGESFGQPERVAPDGIVELVLHAGATLATRFDGETFAQQPAGALVCQTRRFLEFVPAGRTSFLSVRFLPWGACHFLPAPISEIADRQVTASELWGPEVQELQEQLEFAPAASARLRLLEGFLMRQLARHAKPDVEMLVRRLARPDAGKRLSAFCRELGVGERTLERRCRAALGMSPRDYRRLARFLRACDQLRRGAPEILADAAQRCGYYDQAHLNHDFASFLGMTPGHFVRSGAVSFLRFD